VIAAALVAGKLRNQRTLLRRLGGEEQHRATDQLRDLAHAAQSCDDLGSLMGLEGTGARLYFEQFPTLLVGK
jgi:CRISPR-associated protein Cas1